MFRFFILLKHGYRKQPKTSFLRTAENKENMTRGDKTAIITKFTLYAQKAFKMMVGFIDIDTIYNYTLCVKYEGLKLLIRPFLLEDIIISASLWEREIKNVLYNEIKSNDVVVDVGAYIGDNALPIAKQAHKVIAFEPNPQTSRILEKNIELNQIHNIEVVKRPVADVKRKVTFYISSDPMLSAIKLSGPPDKSHPGIEVETIDLDTALLTENRIDWLLIDSEGYEVSVLNGARHVLRKHSPKIIIEILPENYNTVKKILMDEGYYSITQIGTVLYYTSYQNGHNYHTKDGYARY